MFLVGDDHLVAGLPGEALDDDIDRRRELRREGDLVRIGADERRQRCAGGLDAQEILFVGEQAVHGPSSMTACGNAQQLRADAPSTAAPCHHS